MGCLFSSTASELDQVVGSRVATKSESEKEKERLRKWAAENLLDQNENKKKKKKVEKNLDVSDDVLVDAPRPPSSRTNRKKLQSQLSTYTEVHELVLSELNPDGKIGQVGLNNLGNTCFMSTALQCLSSCETLTDYFLGFNFRNEINHTNPLGHQGKIANAFGNIISDIWENNQENSIAPSEFKEAVSSVMPQFQGFSQHDVQEFLAFLLDAIHEDLNRVVETPNTQYTSTMGSVFSSISNDNSVVEKGRRKSSIEELESLAFESWKGYLMKNKSIIVDIFQGQLRSTLQCSTCSCRSIKFDPFMYLSVPVPKTESTKELTLEECIALFCEEEQLIGANGWLCPQCGVKSDATKKLDLWKMPPVLIIHLKRFESNTDSVGALGTGLGKGLQYGSRGMRCKLNTFIKYPVEKMELDWCVAGPQRDKPDYDLFAVANHHGSLWGGHYTAFTKNRVTKEWNQFDDSFVRKLQPESVVTLAAYVLMYQRMQTSSASPQENRKASSSSQSSGCDESSSIVENVNVAACTSANLSAAGASSVPNEADDVEKLRTTGQIRRQSINKPHLWPHVVSSPRTNPLVQDPSVYFESDEEE